MQLLESLKEVRMKEFFELLSLINIQIKKLKKEIVCIYIISFTLTLITIYNSIINKLVIDEVLYKKNINYLYKGKIYILIAIFIISLFIQMILYYRNVKLYTEIDLEVKKNYYNKILNSKYSFLTSISNSELYYRMFHDIAKICEYALSIYVQVPSTIIYFIILVFILSLWSKLMSLGLLVVVFVQIFIIIVVKKPTQKIIKNQTKVEQELVKQVNYDYRDIVDIKLLNLQNYKMDYMVRCMEKYKSSTIRSKFLIQLFGTIDGIINNLWGLMVLVLGSVMVYKQSISIGEYIMISALSFQAIEPMIAITHIFLNFQEVRVKFNRYKEYMLHEEKNTGVLKMNFDNDITINVENLKFKYPNSDKFVLNISSLKFLSGTINGLIGLNGSGKTTLLYILGRILNEECYGKIEINEYNLRDIDIEKFRENVYVLTQKTFIFEGTVRENLVLFKDISYKEIVNSDYFDLIESFVESLPKGLDTIINDTGINFSVGEKQKISLLRMFLHKPKILLLDEPFTGLDISSQNKLISLLKKYIRDNNAIIIIATHQGIDLDIYDKKIILLPSGGYKTIN